MDQWYYVKDSDRVGPVDLKSLKILFHKEEVSLETFVWRKGFANWIRLKEVEELKFLYEEVKSVQSMPAVDEISPEVKVEEKSPEIEFHFDWKKIKEDEELFFIKIGHDRKHVEGNQFFGPYSITELRDALENKHINYLTLIYAAGMKGWLEIGETPLNPVRLTLNEEKSLNAPLMIALVHQPLPLVALIHHSSDSTLSLLGSGAFPVGSEVLGSIYSGTELKAQNLLLQINEYKKHDQKIHCTILKKDVQSQQLLSHYVA